MEVYEKTSYLKAYENHIGMKKIFGDSVKLPAFMQRKQSNCSHPRSVVRKRKHVRDNDSYEPRINRTVVQTADSAQFSCEKCTQSFRSERLFNVHIQTCVVAPGQDNHSSVPNVDEDLSFNSALHTLTQGNMSFSSIASTMQFNDNCEAIDDITEASDLGNELRVPSTSTTQPEQRMRQTTGKENYASIQQPHTSNQLSRAMQGPPQLQMNGLQRQPQLRFPERQPSCTVTSQSHTASTSQGHIQRVPLQTLQLETVHTREAPLPSVSDPDYSFFLNDVARVNRLIREGLESVKKHNYSVKTILKACRDGDKIVAKLDRKDIVVGAERIRISQALFNHLLVSSGNNVGSISTHKRNAMAILFIATWPHMKKSLMTAEDRPWHHWYNIDENTGFLENVVVSNQRSLKRTSGEGIRSRKQGPTQKKPRKLIVCQDISEADCEDENEDYVRDVELVASITATPREKANILHLMSKTFGKRREIFKDRQVSGSAILNKFKHFVSYGGAVILQEFSLLYPGKQNLFLREFPSNLMRKLLKLGEEDKYSKCFPVKFDLLNSLLILAEILPSPRRTFEHERGMPLHAKLFDLFHIVPRGTDPREEVKSKLEGVEYPIQPYILAQGDARSIVEMYLVIDDTKLLKLDEGISVTAAFDLLIKSFFALCMHFPLGWKNVLRFIHVHVFKIPVENRRESSFDEKFLMIDNVRLS